MRHILVAVLALFIAATANATSIVAPSVRGASTGSAVTQPFTSTTCGAGTVRFGATRLAMMTNEWSPSASQLYSVSRIMFSTPDYALSCPRFHFSNWNVNIGGTTPAETTNTNSQTILGAVIECGGKFQTLTFSANAGATLASGGEATGGVWSDAVPIAFAPSQTCFIRTADQVASSTIRTGGYTIDTSIGEGVQYSSASLAELLNSGQVVGANPGTSGNAWVTFGPDSMVGQGTDGRAHLLIAGDSISVGATATPHDARGNIGYMERGLDDNTTSTRMPYGNFGVSGSLYETETSGWVNRAAMLAKLPNVPFTSIWSELGINSVRNNVYAWPVPLQADLQAWWAYLQTLFPAYAIVQSTLTPCTTGTFITTGGQTAAAQCSSGGQLFQLNTYIATIPGTYLSGYIDINAAVNAGGANTNLWGVSSYSGALTGAWVGTSMYVSPPPGIGATLSVATETRLPIILSTDPVNATYATNVSTAPQATRLAGLAVNVLLTSDGLHPGYQAVTAALPTVITAKNGGVFH